MTPRRLLVIIALLSTGMALEPARAAAPAFSGCGKFVKDNATDAADPASDASGGAAPEAEIEAAWVDADGPKPSFNLQLANLSGKAPPPLTSITYDAVYGVGDGTSFVRAHIDFAGIVAYEYGHQEVLPNGTPRYAYDGDTEGEMFPGAHGVVKIVIPPEVGGKPGTALKAVTGEVQTGRTTVVPTALNMAPTRGTSLQTDTASVGAVTIGQCAAPAAGGGGSTGGGTTTPTPTKPGGSAGGSAGAQAGPLPVKLGTRSLKKAKAKKRVAVKLKASEALSAIDVRLSKGKTVVGTGKLAKLAGTGTVKFKLKKAIKKGTYAFDVAGNDSQGRRRIASFKLKVK